MIKRFPKSRIHYPKSGDKQPEATACLFHNDTLAITIKTVKENPPGKLVVQYGLCKECQYALLMDKDGFAKRIDKQLCKRLEDYEQNKAKGAQYESGNV